MKAEKIVLIVGVGFGAYLAYQWYKKKKIANDQAVYNLTPPLVLKSSGNVVKKPDLYVVKDAKPASTSVPDYSSSSFDWTSAPKQ